MPDVCPRCLTTLTPSGACSCDVDGIPPGRDVDDTRQARDVVVLRDLLGRPPHVPFVRLALLDRQLLEVHLDRVEACDEHLDGGVLCERCGDGLAAFLRAVPALVLDLNAQRTGVSGVDYASLGGGSGGSKTLPLVIKTGPIDARDHLRRLLRSLVIDCLVARVADVDPQRGVVPHRGDVPAMAAWLLWRVDGMALHPGFADAADQVATVVRRALLVVDVREPGQDLGPCVTLADGVPCGGRMRARAGTPFAVCTRCETSAEAGPLRERTIDRARARSITAAEIAGLSSYLDLTGTRDSIRKRLNQWHARGQLTPVSREPDGTPRFLFGDLYDRLQAYEGRHRHSWGPWRPVPDTRPDVDTHRQPHTRRCLDCDDTQTASRKPDTTPTTRGA